MPTFFTFEGIKICLFFQDHNPPHFHAFYAEYEILIKIKDLEILEGELPRGQLKKVLAFAQDHQATLLEIWDSLQQ